MKTLKLTLRIGIALVGLAGLILPSVGVTSVGTQSLTPEELAAEAEGALQSLPPLDASAVTTVALEGFVEYGYQDESGRYVIDVLERERADVGVRITSKEGRPVVGAMPNIEMHGDSQLVLTDLVSADDGVMSFAVIAGPMGVDRVTASIGDESIEFVFNIISLRAAGFPQPEVVEGAIPWTDLMSAELSYTEDGLSASFPAHIKEQAGQQVKISGFMMPLQPELEQTHFLITSNPPSCFFHVPGGPAGSVEVQAAEGIEVSWNPIVIEGRFEPQESSEIGVVYRLVDAKLVQ